MNVKPPKSCQQAIQICAWNIQQNEVQASGTDCFEDGGRI